MDVQKIEKLKGQIESLQIEISKIKIKHPRLSPGEYLKRISESKTLGNLLALAKNELNALLHQYSITVIGDSTDRNGKIRKKKHTERLFTDIDCQIKLEKPIDFSDEAISELSDSNAAVKLLLDLIRDNFSSQLWKPVFLLCWFRT